MGARIPEGVIDEIAARARIVEIVGDYVRLTRRGNRYLGLCPFHSEKSPSFHVNAERNLYHCFGCGASGNVYGFLMRHDGLSFPEAVRKVAERVGVVIPEGEQETEASRALRAERELYFEATALAQRYFRAVLTSGRFDAPAAYLRERGIDDETAEAFGIGYAPAQWSSLVDALGKRGVSMPVLEKAGLAMRRREGDGYYDRFRDRVMFPVVSLATKVLAFSGRTLDPNERAKYVNSPETEFYTKGNELFGLHLAHRAIRQEGADSRRSRSRPPPAVTVRSIAARSEPDRPPPIACVSSSDRRVAASICMTWLACSRCGGRRSGSAPFWVIWM